MSWNGIMRQHWPGIIQALLSRNGNRYIIWFVISSTKVTQILKTFNNIFFKIIFHRSFHTHFIQINTQSRSMSDMVSALKLNLPKFWHNPVDKARSETHYLINLVHGRKNFSISCSTFQIVHEKICFVLCLYRKNKTALRLPNFELYPKTVL